MNWKAVTRWKNGAQERITLTKTNGIDSYVFFVLMTRVCNTVMMLNFGPAPAGRRITNVCIYNAGQNYA